MDELLDGVETDALRSILRQEMERLREKHRRQPAFIDEMKEL